MIIPWLKGFMSISKVPLTWTLVAINVFFYFLTLESSNKSRNLNNQYLKESGFYYQQYQKNKLIKTTTDLLADLEDEMTKPDAKAVISNTPSEDLVLQGSLALKDPEFLAQISSLSFHGDQLAIKEWKEKTLSFVENMEKRNVEKFGFRDKANSYLSMITYQFMHASLFHLLGNIFLLILLATAIEQKIGSLLLLVVYLLSGLGGALFYKWFGQSGLIPMIGASGSISGLIAFYALLERKKRVSFFYFISPFQGYYGWIYLPTLMILPFSFLPDLASFLTQDPRLGSSLAHSAHLGGAFFGIILALTFKLLQGEQTLVSPYFQSHSGAP